MFGNVKTVSKINLIRKEDKGMPVIKMKGSYKDLIMLLFDGIAMIELEASLSGDKELKDKVFKLVDISYECLVENRNQLLKK